VAFQRGFSAWLFSAAFQRGFSSEKAAQKGKKGFHVGDKEFVLGFFYDVQRFDFEMIMIIYILTKPI